MNHTPKDCPKSRLEHPQKTDAPLMPSAQISYLTEAYQKADVILEYGSGGSTILGGRMPGKYIMSVESDLKWARQMRQKIASDDIISSVSIYHVDIGVTGPWGRPIDTSRWRDYHRYPNKIWDEPFFRHPDLVLIDGRFRAACFATVLLRCTRPLEILFDDYTVRPRYHEIEQVLAPVRCIDKMAIFKVEPGAVRPEEIGFLVSRYFDMTVAGTGEQAYQV